MQHAPLDLGGAPGVDPFAVQPGSILLGRFCVIGRVRHGAVGWRAAVTDLDRTLGRAPNHCLEFVVLPVRPRDEPVIRRAVTAYQLGERRVYGVASLGDDELALITHRVEHGQPLSSLGSQPLDGALPFLAHLHDALPAMGIRGLRLSRSAIAIDETGQCHIVDWTHLLDLTMEDPVDLPAPSLDSFEALLRELEVPVPQTPAAFRTARELVQHTRPEPETRAPSEVLPAVAPFVGREDALRRAHQAVAQVQHGGPCVLTVRGVRGAGTSRFLDQLALELQRGHQALPVLLAEVGGGDAVLGIRPVMSAMLDAVATLPRSARSAAERRIQDAAGSFGALLNFFDRRLQRLVGSTRPLPPLSLEGRFVRHATTAAQVLSALGTPKRPLVLLLDDASRADASLRALLYHLVAPGSPHHTVLVLGAGATPPPFVPVEYQEIDLTPMHTHEVIGLIESSLPGDVVHAERIAQSLMEQTGGHPRDTWRALEAAVNEGRLVRSDHGWTVADPSGTEGTQIGQVLGFRATSAWSSLDRDAQMIGALLAIRTAPAQTDWLQRVTRWPGDRLQGACARTLDSRLALLRTDGALALASAGAREDVLRSATPPTLARAHRAVVGWLDTLGDTATATQRAWHLEQAAEAGPDPALAEAHTRAGCELLESYDARRARWHFDRALERTDDVAVRLRAMEGRADASMLLDEVDVALSTYLETLQQLDDPLRAMAIANRAVAGLYLTGKTDALLAVANQALTTIGQRLPRHTGDAAWQVIGALWRAWRGHVPPAPEETCNLHQFLVAATVTSHPHVLLSSVFRGWATSLGQDGGPAAAARAMMSVLLSSVGAVRRTNRLLDTATEAAQKANDPFSEGLIHHYRAQNLLGLGQGAAGQRAAEQAIEAFRRSGDLSIGVITMAVATFHALDKEPTDRLLARLDAAEAAAYRHRNRSVIPGLLGMRLWVLTRAGRMKREVARTLADELSRHKRGADLVSAVVGDAVAARALLQLGEHSEARRLSERALHALDQAPIAPPFLQVALLTATHVALSTQPLDRGTAKRAASLVRRLRAARRRAPVLDIASRVAEARLHMARSRFEDAVRCLDVVVSGIDSHGERWHALEGHDLLSHALAGRDAPAAQAHARFAAALRDHLCPPPEPVDTRDATPPPPVRRAAGEVRLDLLIESLDAVVGRHLHGRRLHVTTLRGQTVRGPDELVQLLLVNLVLAAADASPADHPIEVDAALLNVTDTELAHLPGAEPGPWNRIRVRVQGGHADGSRGALAECSDLCRRLDGYLVVSRDDEQDVSAWLPAHHVTAPSHGGLIVVAVSDQAVARTLVEGVRSLGFGAVIAASDDPMPLEAVAVVSDRPRDDELHDVWHFQLVPRGAGWARHTELPVPFLVGELEQLLRPLLEGREPGEPARR